MYLCLWLHLSVPSGELQLEPESNAWKYERQEMCFMTIRDDHQFIRGRVPGFDMSNVILKMCKNVGNLVLLPSGLSTSDLTGLTMRSMDDNQRSVSEMEVQPEGRDQGLEKISRSHGGSPVDLWQDWSNRKSRCGPEAVPQVEAACRAEAATAAPSSTR